MILSLTRQQVKMYPQVKGILSDPPDWLHTLDEGLGPAFPRAGCGRLPPGESHGVCVVLGRPVSTVPGFCQHLLRASLPALLSPAVSQQPCPLSGPFVSLCPPTAAPRCGRTPISQVGRPGQRQSGALVQSPVSFPLTHAQTRGDTVWWSTGLYSKGRHRDTREPGTPHGSSPAEPRPSTSSSL